MPLPLDQFDQARKQGFEVRAVLLHRDANARGLAARRMELEQWFRSSRLSRRIPCLVMCVPAPCIERWLCHGEDIDGRVASRDRQRNCDPWKHAWERRRGLDLDRVRRVAGSARRKLRNLEDFAVFMKDWLAAGLP
jgi:hypothetical protein